MKSSALFGITALAVCTCAGPAHAVFDVIIDDFADTVDFSEWGGILQTATGNSSYGNSYHYISGWGGQSPSARVFYRLPHDLDFPAGERFYNVYAWEPSANSDQWHIINVAGDGTENFDQNISWGGLFGTNKQWLAFDPVEAYDPVLGGRWIKLGPGPQTDITVDGGSGVYIDPTDGPEPYFYVGYQPWYDGTIAFDAIRIIEIGAPPQDGDFDGDQDVDGNDFLEWQRGNSPDSLSAEDLALWEANFGESSVAAVASVPEPASALLVVLGASLAGIVRRARSRRRG